MSGNTPTPSSPYTNQPTPPLPYMNKRAAPASPTNIMAEGREFLTHAKDAVNQITAITPLINNVVTQVQSLTPIVGSLVSEVRADLPVFKQYLTAYSTIFEMFTIGILTLIASSMLGSACLNATKAAAAAKRKKSKEQEDVSGILEAGYIINSFCLFAGILFFGYLVFQIVKQTKIIATLAPELKEALKKSTPTLAAIAKSSSLQ